MSTDAFDRALRAFQRRAPFRPFTVELMTGTNFQVDHPEALVFRNGTAVFIPAHGPLTIFDHESVSRLIDESLQTKAE